MEGVFQKTDTSDEADEEVTALDGEVKLIPGIATRI